MRKWGINPPPRGSETAQWRVPPNRAQEKRERQSELRTGWPREAKNILVDKAKQAKGFARVLYPVRKKQN